MVTKISTKSSTLPTHIYILFFSGKDCNDDDECVLAITNGCDLVNGDCVNKPRGDDYPVGYICTCNTGFRLSEDGFTCIDINECMLV